MTLQTSIPFKRLLGTCVVLSLGISGCTSNPAANSNPSQAATAPQDITNPAIPSYPGIKIDGSSTVFPISELMVKEYRQEKGNKAGQIDIQFSGTGGGFKKFCAGRTDINNASRPILKEGMEACGKAGIRFYKLPIAFDTLTLTVNSQNTWAKDITVEDRRLKLSGAQWKRENVNQMLRLRCAYLNQTLAA